MARRFQPPWAIYKDQMDFLGFGDALWEPSPTSNYTRIRVGDVGFIRRGQFFLLFHAASPLGDRRLGEDVPETFEQLKIGPPVVTLDRQPNCLNTSSIRYTGTDLGNAVAIAHPPEKGPRFPFQLTENRNGAALITNYETYRADATVTSPFEEYTKRHHQSWVAFGRDKGYAEDVRPILVTGFDVTRDFEMVAYSDEDNSVPVKYDVVTEDPNLGTVTTSVWGTERTRCSPHTQRGPWNLDPFPPDRVIEFPSESAKDEDIPKDFNQCIFVRYYTMRVKKPPRPQRMMLAGPGPHDFILDDGRGVIDPEFMAQSDSELMVVDGDDLGDWEYYGSDDDDYEQGVVVSNVPSDKDFDSWNAVADYIFENSDAVSILVHQNDVKGIREEGDTSNIPTLLQKHSPRIVVDENGVGRIIPRESQQLEAPAEQSNTPAEAQ